MKAGGPGEEKPQRRVHRPAHGGELHCFPPGVSGNPGGLPKGFIKPSAAYKKILSLRLDQVEKLARGETLNGWKREVPAAVVMAAGQLLAAKGGKDKEGLWKASATSAIEIADRVEGKVAQVHELRMAELADEVAEKTGLDTARLKAKAAELAAKVTPR